MPNFVIKQSMQTSEADKNREIETTLPLKFANIQIKTIY